MPQHFKARLLEPLQYHSFVDAGASGGTVTAPFLGDIALAFAINAAVLGHLLPERRFVRGKQATGPNYKRDLETIGLRPTVGVPRQAPVYLSPEFQASSYMSEGFEQRKISSGAKHNKNKSWRLYSPVGSSSWRPWRQAQLLAPGNEFTFSILKGLTLPESFAFRMGNGRSCLISAIQTNKPEAVTLNPWSAMNVHEVDVQDLECTSRQYPLAQYPLMHGVKITDALERLG